MPSGRYVKVNITTNWGDSLVCMTTLHACDAEGVKWNVETMPHTAGNTLNGAPKYCSDTDLNDYWQFYASNLPNWWKVDLGQVSDISKFKTQVLSGYQSRNIKDFTVQVSDDDVDWTTILTAQTVDSSDEQVFIIGVVGTENASDFTESSAKINGKLISLDKESVDVYFQWGTSISYGNSTNPQTKTTIGIFFDILTELSAHQTYHYRAVVTDGIDTWYGGDVIFRIHSWNPKDKNDIITLSNDNLTAQSTDTPWRSARACLSRSSGKYYWEVKVDSLGYAVVGVGTSQVALDGRCGDDVYGWGWQSNGYWGHNGWSSFPLTFGTNDIVQVALNLDTGKLWVGKNGTWDGDPVAGTGELFSGISGDIFPMITLNNTTLTVNFGATAFEYSPPAWPEEKASLFFLHG